MQTDAAAGSLVYRALTVLLMRLEDKAVRGIEEFKQTMWFGNRNWTVGIAFSVGEEVE